MITGNHRPRVCLTLMAAIVSTLAAIVSLPLVTQAAPSALPPRPSPQPTSTPSLPPRPIGQPTPESAPVPPPPGGFIELHVLFTDDGLRAVTHWQALWTVVQWQDAFGDWHDVTGWQGTLDEANHDEGKRVWWVDSADFEQGPFRWMVYQGQGGRLLAQSESFYLPHRVDETVSVAMALAP